LVCHTERLKEFDSRVLRKIFGLKRERVTGLEETAGCGDSYSILVTKSSGDKIKEKKMGRVHGWFGGEERFVQRYGGKT